MSERSISHTDKSLFATGENWFLLYCKGREEERAVMHLANQGVEAFFPQAEFQKIQRGKRVLVVEPLFPNYVFAKLDYERHNFTTIRSTRGVIGFVRKGREPQVVSSALIQQIQSLDVNSTVVDKNVPQAGDAVLINHPQYNNIRAIYQEAKGDQRAILLLELINKPVEIIFDNKDFKKI
jgi:transcriptional antiterminator RfaH